MLRTIILTTFLSFYTVQAIGQDTSRPKKASNNDLRTKSEVLSIRLFQKKSDDKFLITSTVSGTMHLEHTAGDKLIKKTKIDSVNAQKIDDEFVEQFIKIKYMMKEKILSKCKYYYFLNMRGDELKVCPTDSSRISIVKDLFTLLKSQMI